MKYFYRIFLTTFALLAALGLQPGGARAQVSNSILVDANGTAGAVEVTVSLNIGGTLPSEWVGWVVDRETLGFCGDSVVQIGGVTAFPTGAQGYVLTDNTALPAVAYKYRIYAVDDVGGRHTLPGIPDFSPAYDQFDYASVANNGYVAQATLVDLGWTVGLTVCQGECWEGLAFISSPPAEFAALAAASATVQIFGQLDAEFEGPYVSEVTSWNVVAGCGTVDNVQENWGNLKARYR